MRWILSTRNLLLTLGLVAVVVGAFSAYDATRIRPTDGAQWLLGGKKVRVVGLVPGGAADRAGLQIGDVIEAIDQQPLRSPAHAAEIVQAQPVGRPVEYMVLDRDGVVRTPSVTMDSTRLTDPITYLIYCCLGLIYFLAGLQVFWNNPNSQPARLFYVLCMLFLLYFFAASERSAQYYWSHVFVRNVGTLASLLLPPFFLHFFLVFPRPRPILERRPWILKAIYVLPALYYLNFTWNQFFGAQSASINTLQQMTLGLFFTAGLASLVSTYFTSPDRTLRQRVKILTLGTVLGTLPFLIFNIALGKLMGREDFALLGAVPMLLVPVSFGYSIARYRLMELEVIVRRSLVYATLTGLVIGAYMLIVVLVGNTVLNLSGQRSQLVAIIATLLIATAFTPARDRIQAFLERRFFREKYDLQEALQELAKAIPHTLERAALEALLRQRISSLLHPRRLELLAVDGGELLLEVAGAAHRLPAFSRLLHRRGSAITPEIYAGELTRLARGGPGSDRARQREELEEEGRLLRSADLELLVPAFAADRLVAALALGSKRSEAAYDGAELEMLQIVAGQSAIQLENTRLYAEAIERRRLEEELALARTIQQRLLPREVPQLRRYDIAALNLPSAQVSGDYYDFVRFDCSMGLVISDVSGKGMAASLLASNLQASIRALSTSQNSPGIILTAANSALYESTDPERFATLFLACLDEDRGKLRYSNAGHNPPLLRRRDGRIEWLDVGSTPLGAFPGMEYPEAEVDMAAGDLLILFTDGITEAENGRNEFFGEKGLQEAVEKMGPQAAELIVEALREAVFCHSGGGAATDDMTMIVVRGLEEPRENATPPGHDA